MTREEMLKLAREIVEDGLHHKDVVWSEDKTLQDLGIDSLMTLEILAEYERRTRCTIPDRYDQGRPWFDIVDGHVNQMSESWPLRRFLNHLERHHA